MDCGGWTWFKHQTPNTKNQKPKAKSQKPKAKSQEQVLRRSVPQDDRIRE
jgi:hypothetical protein